MTGGMERMPDAALSRKLGHYQKMAAVWRLGVHTEFLPEGEACRFIQINETEENSQ